MRARSRLSRRIFSYEEALETFPAVRDLTAQAVRRVEAVLRSTDAEEQDPRARRAAADEACSAIVDAWEREIASLGCEAKGAWLVDWDCGDGCYCWQFPEETLSHFHTYEEGFAGRMPIN